MEEGHEVALNQEVVVHSGDTSAVDFTDAAAAIRAAVHQATLRPQPKK
jgi:uridylate kinase